MKGDEWISSFADRIGAQSPSPEEIGEILGLAAIAAHASERTAAPVACWLAGTTGRSVEDLRRLAEAVDP
jgi:hypothetical protein